MFNKIINIINYIRFFLKKLKTIKYKKVQKINCHIKIIFDSEYWRNNFVIRR